MIRGSAANCPPKGGGGVAEGPLVMKGVGEKLEEKVDIKQILEVEPNLFLIRITHQK
jgi:hypothetical protein